MEEPSLKSETIKSVETDPSRATEPKNKSITLSQYSIWFDLNMFLNKCLLHEFTYGCFQKSGDFDLLFARVHLPSDDEARQEKALVDPERSLGKRLWPAINQTAISRVVSLLQVFDVFYIVD